MTNVQFKKLGLFALMVGAAFVLGTTDALAGGGGKDFKAVVGNVGDQAEAIPGFIQFIMYILGIGLVGKGILAGKKYSENPSSAQGGLLGVLGPLAVGGMLIALPSVAETMVESTVEKGGNATIQGQFSKEYTP